MDNLEVADQLERQEISEKLNLDIDSTEIVNRRPTAFLDGLRGLAALMVYMSHHIPWFYGFDVAEDSLERAWGDGKKDFAMLPFIRNFFTGGSAAVAVFFVLSGYVLSAGPLARLRDRGTGTCYSGLLSASIRRPFRLFLPAAGVSIGFALIMQLPFGLAPHLTWPEPKENLWAQLANWADEFWRIIDPFEPHGIAVRWFPYNPPLWTISIEFRGSIIVFALIAAYSRVTPRIRAILFAVTGLLLLFLYEWSIFCFMAGVVLAINDQEGFDIQLLKRYSSRARNMVHVGTFMFGWWLLGQPAGRREPERAMKAPGWYYMTMFVPGSYYRDEYWRYWHAWGSVLVVYGVLKIRLLQRLFNTRYLQFLGKVSFSLYLTHIPFLWTIGDRIYRTFGTATMDFTTDLDDWIYVPDFGPRGLSTRFVISQAFILSLNLLLARALTKWLDEPSVKVGHWVAARILRKNTAVPRSPVVKSVRFG